MISPGVRARTPVFGLIGIDMLIRDTVADVYGTDSRCGFIGKIFARDLRLVASRLYMMAVTRPWVMYCRYLIPICGADLVGCIKGSRDEEWKGDTLMPRTYSYEIIRPSTDQYCSG